MLDIINSFPWVYRGWLFIFYELYRDGMRREWSGKSRLYVFVDIAGSAVCFFVELGVVLYFIYDLMIRLWA